MTNEIIIIIIICFSCISSCLSIISSSSLPMLLSTNESSMTTNSKKITSKTKNNIGLFNSKNYTLYESVVRMGTDSKSSIGDDNGCINNISVEDAKIRCNAQDDCDGFFAYDSINPGRVCFKKQIYTNDERTYALDEFRKDYPNNGYFVAVDQSNEKVKNRKYELNINKNVNGGVSTNWKKDDRNGCFNNISVQEAKKRCDAKDDCNGFFTYNYKGIGRVCFVDRFTSFKEVNKNSDMSNPAFYTVNTDDNN